MLGDVEDGKVEGEDMTMTESIKQDVVGYKQQNRRISTKLYHSKKEHRSRADGHTEVLEIIFWVDREDVSGIQVPDVG
jgi:hypothetical protein